MYLIYVYRIIHFFLFLFLSSFDVTLRNNQLEIWVYRHVYVLMVTYVVKNIGPSLGKELNPPPPTLARSLTQYVFRAGIRPNVEKYIFKLYDR